MCIKLTLNESHKNKCQNKNMNLKWLRYLPAWLQTSCKNQVLIYCSFPNSLFSLSSFNLYGSLTKPSTFLPFYKCGIRSMLLLGENQNSLFWLAGSSSARRLIYVHPHSSLPLVHTSCSSQTDTCANLSSPFPACLHQTMPYAWMFSSPSSTS